MDKNDWIWVAIRIFGIYLLVLAVLTIPDLISSTVNTYMYWNAFGSIVASREGQSEAVGLLRDLQTNVLKTSFSSLVAGVVRLVCYSAFGYYLLRKGNFLFKVISRQQPPQALRSDATKSGEDS